MVVIIDGTDGVDTPAINAGNIVGQVCFFGMTTPPSGFLACDGAAVMRDQYSALFTAIGTTYGAGDGSTTFNLPDLRGEFIRGLDGGRGVDSGRGLGTAQADEIKAHKHRVQSTLGSTNASLSPGGATGFAGWNNGANGFTDGNNLVENTGGTETRPRNVALLACIKF
jgi:microcystin-dependent protein